MSKTKNLSIIKNGLLVENPTFVQMLGMCPTLAVTVSLKNGLGMGLATTAVLIMANAAISALRNVIPSKIRIPAFIVVIASAVTIVGMLMETYMSSLFEVLGLFIPLIVVNCIILARAEAFAFENKVFPSLLDGIGMGLGFTMSLGLIGIVREFFGGFTFFDMPIPYLYEHCEPMLIFIQPPGAFLTLALLLALYNYYGIAQENKAKAKADEERDAIITAQLEATRISEEKYKLKQEEKARKKKEAEAKKKAEEEAARAAEETEEAKSAVSDKTAENNTQKDL